jgi:phage portal protein BeeE
MNFLQILGQGLYNIGTNRFTKTTPLQYFNQNYSTTKEEYVSINDNEFELYRTTPQLSIVINKDAQMLSNGRFVVKNLKGEVQDNHEALKLLANPNPIQNQNSWLMDYQIQKNIYGNQFIYINRAYNSAFPSTLVNLNSAYVKVVKSGKYVKQNNIEDIIERYEVKESNGSITTYEVNDIIFSQIVNPNNPLMGLSPLHSLTMPISNIRGAYGFRNKIIVKSGALGILSSASKDASGGIPLNNTERQRIEQQHSNDYGIHDGQSSLIMTGSPLSWQSMSYPTKDLLLFEEVEADFKSIIDAYGHNADIYSNLNNAKFSNMNEALRQTYQNRIIPESEQLCFNLSNRLGLTAKGLILELDYSHIEVMKANDKEVTENFKMKADAISTLLNSGYTRQEIDKLVTL